MIGNRCKRVSIVSARGLQQLKTFGFAQVALAMRFKKNSLPDAGVNDKFQLVSREKPISHECRAMPVFGVKFNVEFTRQALGCYSNLLILTYLSQFLLMNDEVEMTP